MPYAFATAFHTPQGVILHSGDFKLDLTPVDGRRTDLSRIGAIASSTGVRLLLSDSTNAEEPGHAPSERDVGRVLTNLFRQHEGRRIITASFASHIHRIQQIADAAIASGRVVATLGLSVKRNVRLAREIGLLHIPDASLVDIEDVADMAPGKVCVISTGSQGEPMSALALLASGDNRWLKLTSDDTVILSSHAIPGNEHNVNKVIDGLLRVGAEVVHSGVADVHATGHAQAEELKMLMSIAKPELFIPVHGEFRHLMAHARLANQMGIADGNILLARTATSSMLTDEGIDFAGRVPAGYLYVDGIVGDVGHGVLRDRRVLAEEGVVVVVLTIDGSTGNVITGPEIITRGWVYAPEAEDLIDEATDHVRRAVEHAYASGTHDTESLQKTRAPGRGPVRERAHAPQADDRARGDGGVAASSASAERAGVGDDRGDLLGRQVAAEGGHRALTVGDDVGFLFLGHAVPDLLERRAEAAATGLAVAGGALVLVQGLAVDVVRGCGGRGRGSRVCPARGGRHCAAPAVVPAAAAVVPAATTVVFGAAPAPPSSSLDHGGNEDVNRQMTKNAVSTTAMICTTLVRRFIRTTGTRT